jgi:hypothetical protein
MVCRHNVLRDAGWAAENGHKNIKIVVYTVHPALQVMSLGMWDAHAQAVSDKGWIDETMGIPTVSKVPTYTPNGWIRWYALPEYMRLMGKACFNGADCRDEGVPY